MTRYVVDASVAAKWFLPEEYSDQAVRLKDQAHELIAPDFLVVEVANVMLKRIRSGQFTANETARLITGLPKLVGLIPSPDLVGSALTLAERYARSIYDALYVALALRDRAPLVTADRRLYNALQPSLHASVMWVADLTGA